MSAIHPVAGSSRRTISAVAAAGAAAWLALLVVSPYLVTQTTPGGGLFTAGGIVYLAGQAICHQRADRSFHAWGVQLPVCGRCVGLYAGAALGGLLAVLLSAPVSSPVGSGISRMPDSPATPPDWLLRFTVAAAPTAASLALELTGVWTQSPAVRCVAAGPLGLAVGWFVAAHAPDLVQRVAGAPQA